MNKYYEESSVQAIANAIRAKTCGNETYKIAEMAPAILLLTGYSMENITSDPIPLDADIIIPELTITISTETATDDVDVVFTSGQDSKTYSYELPVSITAGTMDLINGVLTVGNDTYNFDVVPLFGFTGNNTISCSIGSIASGKYFKPLGGE